MGESTVILFTSDRLPALAEKLRAHRQADAHTLLEVLEDLGIPQRGVTIDPAEPDTILAAARGADLVVIGSHGRKGAPRLIFGSVAEEVARKAPCPVMIVHGPR